MTTRCNEAEEFAKDTQDLKAKLKEAEEDRDAFFNENQEIKVKWQAEQKERMKFMNELEDIKGNIRVFCRIRPLSKSELADPEKSPVCVDV